MGMSTDGFAITPYLNSWAYQQEAPKKKFKYLAKYKDKSVELRADSQHEAIELVIHYFRCKNRNRLTVFRISDAV